MKLIKVLTLTLALNGIAPPAYTMQMAQESTTTIEGLSARRIQEAYDAYTHELTWSPMVHYAAFGALTAVGCYALYRLTQKPVITTETTEQFKNFNAEQKETIVAAASKIVQELAAQAKEAADKAKDATKDDYWLQTKLSDMTSSVSSSAYSIVSYGTAYGIINYVQSKLSPIIPTTGNLLWYLGARTDYSRNVGDIQRYLMHYGIYQDEIKSVMQLLVFDIEKVSAYLQHFNEYLAEQTQLTRQAFALATCQRYAKNITTLMNELVDASNNEEPAPVLAEKLDLVVSEVRSATIFVNAYHR